MTEATSSSSSTFGLQDMEMGVMIPPPHLNQPPLRLPRCLIPRRIAFPECGPGLNVPEDILELVRKSTGWDKSVDLSNARLMYTCVRLGQEYPNFSIQEELEKLKGLSTALASKHDIYAEEYEKFKMEYDDYFRSLAEKLVEQVPDIKGYKHLTTRTERDQIEKALQKKGIKQQDEEPDLAIHLEDLREKLWPLDEKCREVSVQFRRIDLLRSNVKSFIKILTEAKQSRFNHFSRSSSTFGKQVKNTGVLAPPLRLLHPLPVSQSGSLKVPEDIVELLRKSVGWDKLVDLSSAQLMYSCVLRGHNYPNFNIEKELEKLKGLSSALGNKYDTYVKEYRKFKTRYDDRFQSLVEELVEQVPDIKYMSGYECLITETERFRIERALQKKEVKVEDPYLALHLEELRRELRPMAAKHEEGCMRLGRIARLCSTVNNFIQILTEAKISRLQKFEEKRKEVEGGLLRVLKEVGGMTFESSTVNTEFRKKWDSIVDDFTTLAL